MTNLTTATQSLVARGARDNILFLRFELIERTLTQVQGIRNDLLRGRRDPLAKRHI